MFTSERGTSTDQDHSFGIRLNKTIAGGWGRGVEVDALCLIRDVQLQERESNKASRAWPKTVG